MIIERCNFSRHLNITRSLDTFIALDFYNGKDDASFQYDVTWVQRKSDNDSQTIIGSFHQD